MDLYILRHGDAVESSFYQDRDRPLSDLGRRQIQAVAHFFQTARMKPDLILSSPLVRAQQSCDLIREDLGVKDSMTTNFLVPGSNFRDLMKEISSRTVATMLLVGHEPQLSGLISVMTGGDEQFRLEMKKASLACLSVPQPLKKGHAVLNWLLSQSVLTLIR